MPIDIDEDNLKAGILGLVVAIVEIVKDALKLQAVKRMESGGLSNEEIERLGLALKDLDKAIDQIKEEQGVSSTVQSVRDGLDDIVDDVLNKMLNPAEWAKQAEKNKKRLKG
ncbi:gas vesicle protein K [Patescibacteria group bacterium AH-259-L05]|nr:gas vesicle protein K [Patescibacteria group bacterium AH-259-L05]